MKRKPFFPAAAGATVLLLVAFSPVRGDSPRPGSPPALPRGLTAEHTLRLDSYPGATDLVIGKLSVRGASIRNRLADEGWEVHGQAGATGLPWLLEKRTGKETTVVWLDEAEGTFLLIRETGR